MSTININLVVQNLIRVTYLADKLLSTEKQPTEEEILQWMVSPKNFLFRQSPVDVCLSGDPEPLIKWIKDRLGEEIEAE